MASFRAGSLRMDEGMELSVRPGRRACGVAVGGGGVPVSFE